MTLAKSRFLSTSPLKYPVRALLLYLTALSLSPMAARAQDLSQERFDFCRKAPLNSRCEGLSLPLSLEDRPGKDLDNCALAVFAPDEKPYGGDCEYELTETALILYVETGEKLKLLGNKRATRVITLAPEDIFTLQSYASFRRGGLLAGRKREIAEIGFKLEQSSTPENQSNYIEIEDSKIEFRTVLAAWLSTHRAPKYEQWSQRWLETGPAPLSQAEAIEQLKTTRACVACDLSNADLEGMDLEGVNLERAQLKGANLSGSKLRKAYLMGANLQQATLSNADLRDARLAYSNLAEALLDEADLSGANLEHANLAAASLNKASLKTSDRRLTWLVHANLSDANLQEAKLEGANLTSANLQNADLEKANFSTKNYTFTLHTNYMSGQSITLPMSYVTQLVDTNLAGANLFQANLDGARLARANFNRANLSEANLEDTKILMSEFQQANLSAARLKRSQLTGVDFSNTNLLDANLDKAVFCDVTLSDGERFEACDESEN